LYYWMIFDHKNAYLHSKELLAPGMLAMRPAEYLDGILEHVTSCVCLGYFEEALAGLSLAADFVKQHKFDQSNAFLIRIFYYDISYKLIIYSYMGAVDALKEAIETAELKTAQYG